MLGKEDAASGGSGGGGSAGPCQLSSSRKTFWRSASWSSSRTMLPPLNPENDKDSVDPNGNSNGQNRRFPAPLTPRSQSKARACLPPLQPLSIARRSLDEWPKASSDDVGEWPLPITPGGRDLNNGGERLKLDLSTIQRNPDKNDGLVKREKIAFFDKKCSKVAEHIYLGGDAVARDRDILKQHGITHILNCVGFVCPEYFKADFMYRTLWLQDSPSEDITSILYDVFDYFEDVREQGGRVFVHCCQGVSRSTSLVIAYLMWREGQSFDDAFQYVKAARGIADPNMGFACQLLQCQKRVHAFPLSPSSLLRMYRIAPHSPYDPLHLVPKMLNDPSPAALDSRGAFIIHIPSAIYVWIGKKCEVIMERDARGAVCQIVRYEKAQGPIVMIKEGEEPSFFWDSFLNLLPLMGKSSNGVDVVDSFVSKICLGERKVDIYNVDFEIFQKAIVGGFVPPFPSSETGHETHLPARESSWSVLRRKFASGNMKEFFSASKLRVSRVYPDSMLVVGVENTMTRQIQSSENLSSSSSSPSSVSSSLSSSASSSPSPSFFSPDSNSSDSSISLKFVGDSPAMSPSMIPSRNPRVSPLSSFSNLSLGSSQIPPHSISKTSQFIDVNFTSQPSSKLVPSPSNRTPLSIAERRGGLSKCLKLPVLTDDLCGKDHSTSEPYDFGLNRNCCELDKPRSDDTFIEVKGDSHSNQGSMLQFSPGSNSYNEQTAVVKTREELGSKHSGGEKGLTAMMDSQLACSNTRKSVVYGWPNLEKVANFNVCDLDSQSVFIFICQTSDSTEVEGRVVLYLWVGRSFNCDEGKIQLGGSKEFGDIGNIDWSRVTSTVLGQIGLPLDTNIMIVKENEEPAELIALLSSL